MCASGQDNMCGHRFDGQFGELPQGYDHKFVYSHFGFNLKITDLQAAVGCEQLKKLPGFIKCRRDNWEKLKKGLQDCTDKLVLPEPTVNSKPSWFGFIMTVKEGVDCVEVVKYLEEHNVQTRRLFGGNLVKHPCFDEMRKNGEGYRIVGGLDNTDRIMRDSFWVGVYPGLDEDRINYIIKMIHEALGK